MWSLPRSGHNTESDVVLKGPTGQGNLRSPARTGNRKRPSPGRGTKIPFRFVIDYLAHLDPVVRPMFGCHAIYIRGRIVLILRHRTTHPESNGVWVATSKEHHQRLRKLFPSLRSIRVLGRAETNWQMIPECAGDFEESVLQVCDLIVKGDPGIGKLPHPKSSRNRRVAVPHK